MVYFVFSENDEKHSQNSDTNATAETSHTTSSASSEAEILPASKHIRVHQNLIKVEKSYKADNS